MTSENSYRLPAEWEPQEAVLLTWPHENSDWLPILEEVQATYLTLVEHLLNFVNVFIVAPPKNIESLDKILESAGSASPHSVRLFAIESNDTWARDHGPICVQSNDNSQKYKVLDFVFNGWGNKFEADKDNAITRRLVESFALGNTPLESVDFVLEGGAIESDGKGTLLTTEQCLLNPNRNLDLNKKEIEKILGQHLGASKVLWLKNGYLAGDDTDSHIDTLARLAPDDTIVYVACDDQTDEHYTALKAMESELKAFTTANGAPYRLIPLPWPAPIFDAENNRLPATYANFLISNQTVLVPTYRDSHDKAAIKQVSKAFPDYQVIGIDCRSLIKQHGSLHCITMQIPKGVIATSTAR